MRRRKFLKTVAAGASAFALPRFSIGKSGGSPNEKLNVAFVGVGGIGNMSIGSMYTENRVALCDVDSNRFGEFPKKFPKAKLFADYRVMLDKMGRDIDAVCISTPDHSHFKIAMDCMQCGKHVAVQKPLAHDIWQCRQLAKAQSYYKVQTQMMNQGHATSAIRMIKEWYDSGVAGAVRTVHVISAGPSFGGTSFAKPKEGLPLNVEPVPPNLDWELWVNSAKFNPYNHIYAPLTWRGFWDYGTGRLGDWFCHTADAPVWALDLKDPVSVELLDADYSFDPKVFIPNRSTIKWTFAATDKRPAVEMFWYDGGNLPAETPKDFDAGRKYPRAGMFMVGDKHTIETGARPNEKPCMSDSKFFADFKRNLPPKTIPRVRRDSLYFEWIDAIHGGPECGMSFRHSSNLSELALLGALTQRFGGKIIWDAKNMKATNRPELAPFIREPLRKNWHVAGREQTGVCTPQMGA